MSGIHLTGKQEFYSGAKAKEYLAKKSYDSSFHDWTLEVAESENRRKSKDQLEVILEKFKTEKFSAIVFSDLVAPVVYSFAESKGLVAVATQFLPGTCLFFLWRLAK